jgi:hypothetical protein
VFGGIPATRRRYADLRDRIIANTVMSDDLFDGEPCWLWMGARNARGYGIVTMRVKGVRNPKRRLVHRLAIMLWHGLEWHQIDNAMHLCNVKQCCNPKHLSNGTNSENQLYYHASKRRREPGDDDDDTLDVPEFLRAA